MAAMKVLVVDDIMICRMLAARLLETRGHFVRTEGNGKDAIKALSGEDFDLVLMDIRMPVMSGIEAARIIRDATSPVRCHRVPILAVSAGCDADEREGKRECLKAGMDGYVNKPIRPGAFVEIVERYGRMDRFERPSII